MWCMWCFFFTRAALASCADHFFAAVRAIVMLPYLSRALNFVVRTPSSMAWTPWAAAAADPGSARPRDTTLVAECRAASARCSRDPPGAVSSASCSPSEARELRRTLERLAEVEPRTEPCSLDARIEEASIDAVFAAAALSRPAAASRTPFRLLAPRAFAASAMLISRCGAAWSATARLV